MNGVTNPRYSPRDFAVNPSDFGQKKVIDWTPVPADATPRELAQRDASHFQHLLCFGVLKLYMPTSNVSRITKLAARLEVPYDRLQKMLSGRVVMQLEDIGRFHVLIGHRLDYWMLRGPSSDTVRMIEERMTQERRARMKAGQQAPAARR
jgi:hypothetical protein